MADEVGKGRIRADEMVALKCPSFAEATVSECPEIEK